MALTLLENRGLLPLPAMDGRVGWVPKSAQQLTFIECRAQIALYGGASGGGKLLCVDTPTPTPFGWTRLGDLRRGDVVFDDHGRMCTVRFISDVEPEPESYRLTFDDGSYIDACTDHLWHTFTSQDRTNMVRFTDEFRLKRQRKRASKAKGNKSVRFSESISKRNSEREYSYSSVPQGAIRTTREILETLRTKDKRNAINHSVRVASALEIPEIELPLDPYVLGVWLGDGTRSSIVVTGLDLDIWPEIEKAGFTVNHSPDPKRHSIPGLTQFLRKIGVWKNKHVPEIYLRSSINQRLALLQGLMDTDGNCDKDGKAEFCNTNKRIAFAVHELALSLGLKATIKEARAKLNGRDCGPKWRVSWTAQLPVFRIRRKLERLPKKLRGCQQWRFIVDVQPIDPRPMRCIQVDSPSNLYLAGPHMIPTHNTNVLVADSAQEYDNPQFRGILLRKSYTEMTNIMDEMERIYSPLGGRKSDGGKLWRFPSGALMRLGYMASDKDIELYTGKPISWLGIDEAQFQTEDRVRALLPWVSTPTEYGLRDRVRITANPSTPWLMAVFLNNACPVCHPERSVIPAAVYAGARWKKDDSPVMMTTAFIPAKLEDNPLYDERKLAMLMSQTADVQKKLILGCWCHTEGAFFPFLNESYVLPYSECGEQWWMTHFLSMDYGYANSAAATGLYFLHENGKIFKVGEDTQRTMKSEEYAHHIARKFILRETGGRRCQIVSGYADPAMDAHTGTGQSNLDLIQGVFDTYQLSMVKAAKDRVGNAQLLSGKLSRREYILTDLVPKTFESLTSRKNDPDMPGAILKIHGDELDDILDENLYGLNQFLTGDKKPDQVKTEEKIQELIAAGVDQRSIAVTRFKMEREAAQRSGPVTFGKPTLNRSNIHR